MSGFFSSPAKRVELYPRLGRYFFFCFYSSLSLPLAVWCGHLHLLIKSQFLPESRSFLTAVSWFEELKNLICLFQNMRIFSEIRFGLCSLVDRFALVQSTRDTGPAFRGRQCVYRKCNFCNSLIRLYVVSFGWLCTCGNVVLYVMM
jgi:hypothetical protein